MKTVTVTVELSVDDDADQQAVADALFEYLVDAPTETPADPELIGLPAVICSIDGTGLHDPYETARLRRWKTEAIIVIERYDAIWEALGRPGRIGEPKSTAVANLIAQYHDVVTAARAVVAWKPGDGTYEGLVANLVTAVRNLERT